MIDSYKDFIKYIHSFTTKPKLLLHACCAPCSSHVLLLLKEYFDITIFFSNDNIHPLEEYKTRATELKSFCEKIDSNMRVIIDNYTPKDYYDSVLGLEHLGEKSMRCYECYKLRLEKTALMAKEKSFDFFTTTLSISPYKVEKWINEIGYNLEEKYNIKYLYSNFKKENGYLHSIELSKQYGLYRQDYCGCVFSIAERKCRDD